jgi:hypothetical protein
MTLTLLGTVVQSWINLSPRLTKENFKEKNIQRKLPSSLVWISWSFLYIN